MQYAAANRVVRWDDIRGRLSSQGEIIGGTVIPGLIEAAGAIYNDTLGTAEIFHNYLNPVGFVSNKLGFGLDLSGFKASGVSPEAERALALVGLITPSAAGKGGLVREGIGLTRKTLLKSRRGVFDKVVRNGRSGRQARLREIMNDPKASSADRGWLRNDQRHIQYGNKRNLRLPRNGRLSPGRKAEHKGYELAHLHNAPASQGNNYARALLKNAADHKVETRLHRHRYGGK